MELKEVEYILNDDYLTYMKNYLNRIVDPSVPATDYYADVEVENLDCYEEVRNFIFD